MALLLRSVSPLPSPFSPSSSSSPYWGAILPVAATPISRLRVRPSEAHGTSFSGFSLHVSFVQGKRILKTAKASAEMGEVDPKDGEVPSSSSQEAAVAVDKLPLESKLQERQEQRLRMKLAKKVRLRRKRLLRKRKMRKKGRWPPSKMKKLKNV